MSRSQPPDLQLGLLAQGQTAFTRNDFYTPPSLFEALALEFDLDVCAPPGGVPWIPAKRFYTWQEDGLTQPWEGRVWMNPPYSKPAPWVERWLAHGHGLALVPSARSQWYANLWASGAALVNLAPALEFIRPETLARVPMPWPPVLAAFGAECVEAIGRLGVRVR